MDPFSNYRRHVASNWGGSAEPRQSLLPNPVNYGRRLLDTPSYGFQPQFNRGGIGGSIGGSGDSTRFHPNFLPTFKRDYQSFSNDVGNLQLNFDRPSFQQQPQPLLQQQPRFDPAPQRWKNDNRRDDGWKKKGGSQRFGGANKNKPKANNWGKKRQRNPSKEEKNKKLHKDDDDECWDEEEGSGGVFVIDEEMEKTISSAKKPDDETKETTDSDTVEPKEKENENDEKKTDEAPTAPTSALPSTKVQNQNSPNIPPDRRAEKFYCALCDAKCGNENNYRFHCEGNRHLRNLNASKGLPVTTSPRKQNENKAGPGGLDNSQEFPQSKPQPTNNSDTQETGIPKQTASNMQNKLNNYPAPIIGLNYIIELQSESQFCEPKYECSLCDTKCDSTNLLAHITGSEHRMTYMMKHHKLEYDRLSNTRLSKDEFAVELIRAVEKIQRTDGRGQLKTQSGFSESEATSTSISPQKPKKWVFKEPTSLTTAQCYLDQQRAKWKDNAVTDDYFTTDSFDGFDKNDGGDNNSTGISSHLQYDNAPKTSAEDNEPSNPFREILEEEPENLSFSKGSLGALLTVLSKCEVKNEEDAQMALQVSNALTASLFKYRVQSMSSECVQVLKTSNLTSNALKRLVDQSNTENVLSPKSSQPSQNEGQQFLS